MTHRDAPEAAAPGDDPVLAPRPPGPSGDWSILASVGLLGLLAVCILLASVVAGLLFGSSVSTSL